LLLNSYRSGAAADPDTYVSAIVSLLTAYPEQVVCLVTDPRTGIARKIKWLPTVFEVREACEREMYVIREEERRAKRREETNKVLGESPRPPGSRPIPEVVRRLQADLAANIATSRESRSQPPNWKTLSAEQLAEKYAADPPRLSDELRAKFTGSGPSIADDNA
jgi:hypothetical protein